MRLTTLLTLLPLFTPALAARNPFHFKRQSSPADPSAAGATAPPSSDVSQSQGTPTSTSSAASFSPSTLAQGIPCSTIADCPKGSFCNQYGHGINACLAFNDCRANGCPGGDCVPGNPARTDPTDPDAGFICSFPSNNGPSSALGSMDSASSMTPSTSSGSVIPSSLPTGNAGDCRSTGCSHHESCVANFESSTASYICVDCASPDCRSTGCADGSFCSFYSPSSRSRDYVCLMSSSFPATSDCRQMGCPGGVCGYNGNSFQCYFGADAMSGRYCPGDGQSISSTASSTPSSPSLSSSPSSTDSSIPVSVVSSSMASKASGEPAPSVASGTGAPHPPPSNPPSSTSNTPAPPPTSDPAPGAASTAASTVTPVAPAETSKTPAPPKSGMPVPSVVSMMPHPAEPSVAPAPEVSHPPAQSGDGGDGSKSGSGCDLGGIYDLLWQIKADLYTVKCDVEAIKAKLDL